jgi:hypothetical protein
VTTLVLLTWMGVWKRRSVFCSLVSSSPQRLLLLRMLLHLHLLLLLRPLPFLLLPPPRLRLRLRQTFADFDALVAAAKAALAEHYAGLDPNTPDQVRWLGLRLHCTD